MEEFEKQDKVEVNISVTFDGQEYKTRAAFSGLSKKLTKVEMINKAFESLMIKLKQEIKENGEI